MINLFLDTNVVIDFLTDRKPYSHQAGKLFDYSEKGEVKFYLSAISINNIYYIVKNCVRIKKRLEY